MDPGPNEGAGRICWPGPDISDKEKKKHATSRTMMDGHPVIGDETNRPHLAVGALFKCRAPRSLPR